MSPLKRSGIVRRAPIAQSQSGIVSRQHKPLPAQSARAKAVRAPRAAAEQELGRANGIGVCARCLRTAYVNGHERTGRAQGGNPAKPDCLLCTLCNGWAEDWPREAAFDGWKISRKHVRDPNLGPDEARNAHGGIHHFGGAA